jgi:hypothetical protein
MALFVQYLYPTNTILIAAGSARHHRPQIGSRAIIACLFHIWKVRRNDETGSEDVGC